MIEQENLIQRRIIVHLSLAINAALETLIRGQDPDAQNARLIIEYGSCLQSAGSWSLSLTFPWKKKDSFTGTTNELGNVQINEEETENKEIGKLIKKERIGNYRLWKIAEGYLAFHHYWASSISTRVDDGEVTTYHLFYDPKTMKELAFAEAYVFQVRKYHVFGQELITFTTFKLDVKYGSVPKKYSKRVLNRANT